MTISEIRSNVEALRVVQDLLDELWVPGDLLNGGPEPAAGRS